MGTLRTELNSQSPNRANSAFNQAAVGEALNLLLSGATYTETGVTVTTNVATLANQPSALFDANGTTATSTGSKKLLKGPITGAGAIVPAAGECVWDGGVKVLFNSVDAVTVAKFLYARAANATMSLLQRDMDSLGT